MMLMVLHLIISAMIKIFENFQRSSSVFNTQRLLDIDIKKSPKNKITFSFPKLFWSLLIIPCNTPLPLQRNRDLHVSSDLLTSHTRIIFFLV